MKIAIILACISVVFCTPDKRFFLGPLTSFNTTHLKETVQTLLNVVGTDATEGLCETECHTLMTDPTHFLHYSCPLVCHGLQSLAQSFHLVPATTAATNP
ncbi:hypothetical protein CHS0354_030947 [Potamilus streckersoni]|uniref:Uncharacterized protein n=1 Tax=Potamilus streckersoni TaxID=2493646 RepID=A0AAE0RZ49_9BIVA|nr:hypothetical protein CHS0354_030947 [Potamilus streckersoni]